MAKQNLELFSESGAIFSPCRKYRYRLWRSWDKSQRPVILWVMLNPSTADEFENDPTVERCERRSRTMGYGGMEVVNIFAYRSTNPNAMKQQTDPIGPENNAAILEAAKISGMVVCAWGAHGDHMGRGKEVAALLRSHGIALHCLTTTEKGHPGHPLYVGYAAKPVSFEGLR